MATLNISIDDTIQHDAFLAFQKMGISPSDGVRAFLAYVASTGEMPIKQMATTDDTKLVELIKQRMGETDKIHETTLDELFA